MAKYILIIFIFIIYGCDYDSRQSDVNYPSQKELKYKIGDCLYFKTSDSTYSCVIVSDFFKDAGGVWYSTFFTNYDSTIIPTLLDIKKGKVMGRKIESSIDIEGYKIGFDGEFIHDTLFTNTNNFKLIGNIHLKNKIDLGSKGMITSMSRLKISFLTAKKIRLNPPDNYKDYLIKQENFHPEEYFDMGDFL